MGDNKGSRGTEFLGSPDQVFDASQDNARGTTLIHGTGVDERSLLELPDLDELPGAPLALEQADVPPLSTLRVPAYVLEEITQMVREALARFGIPGELEVTPREAILTAPQGSRRVAIDAWISRWATFDNASRRERTSDVARKLAQGRRASPPPTTGRRITLDPRIIAGCVLLIGLFIFFYVDSQDNSEPDAGNDTGSELARTNETTGRQDSLVRDSQVCETTRARVFQGGSVGPADIDGWLVEIALLKRDSREPLHTHPGLAQFVEAPEKKSGSLYIWPRERLTDVVTAHTLVRVEPLEISGSNDQRIAGVVLVFQGRLVDAYFDEAARTQYFHLAHELANTVQATHAALYARCFDDDTHAIGSWFMGLDSGGASTALLYFMGTYARPLHIAPPFARPPGENELNRFHAFTQIETNASRLDRASLATLLGSQGGMATGKPDAPVVIHFPFPDANRASRASRAIARVTSLSE